MVAAAAEEEESWLASNNSCVQTLYCCSYGSNSIQCGGYDGKTLRRNKKLGGERERERDSFSACALYWAKNKILTADYVSKWILQLFAPFLTISTRLFLFEKNYY